MKRVYMLSSQLMFSRGVETLLGGQEGLVMVGRETDPCRAIEQIRELEPDVVILDSKDLASAPSTVMTDILREAPNVKIISLNLTNDQIRVYRGEQRTAQSIGDLLLVIDDEKPELDAVTPEEWMGLAEGRAQVYGFLSGIFHGGIDEHLLENLCAGSMRLIGSLEQGEDLTGDLREGVRALEKFQRELAGCSLHLVKDHLIEEYVRLLEEMPPTGVTACEAMYLSTDDPNAAPLNSSLESLYTRGGLALQERMPRPDFIGCELSFMQHLCLQESAAWGRHDHPHVLEAQASECAFVRDHLVRWIPRFCEALALRTGVAFYRGIACLTKGFILNEAYRVASLME